jgi:hypothetical protein
VRHDASSYGFSMAARMPLLGTALGVGVLDMRRVGVKSGGKVEQSVRLYEEYRLRVECRHTWLRRAHGQAGWSELASRLRRVMNLDGTSLRGKNLRGR